MKTVMEAIDRAAGPLALLALGVAIAGGSAYAGTQLGGAQGKASGSPSFGNVTKTLRGADDGSAESVRLLKSGPFTFKALCATNDGPDISYSVELRTSHPQTVLRGAFNAVGGVGGYFEPGEVATVINGTTDATFVGVDEVQYAFAKGSSLQATITAAVKNGNVAAGPGPYGQGRRCLFNVAWNASA